MMVVVRVVMLMVVIMMMTLVGMSVNVKVLRKSDFEIHSARDGIYGGYADCGVFVNRWELGLGTDRRTIFWNGGYDFGVQS